MKGGRWGGKDSYLGNEEYESLTAATERSCGAFCFVALVSNSHVLSFSKISQQVVGTVTENIQREESHRWRACTFSETKHTQGKLKILCN